MVMSVRPSLRPGLIPSVTVFRTFLLHALTYWAEILYVTLFLWTSDQVWVPSIFVGVMPLLELKILVIIFQTFLMLWHIKHKFRTWLKKFVFLYCRSGLSVINLRQSIFVGVMSLLELRIMEIHVFHNFLLHALTYGAEILHMTLFYCTTDQLWVSSICVNFCRSYAPFSNENTGNTQCSHISSTTVHALTYWAEILNLTFI